MAGDGGESEAGRGEAAENARRTTATRRAADATTRTTAGERGSPYAPHTPEQTRAMLDAVGVDDEEALFDVPESVRFDGAFGIEPRSEADARRAVESRLADNDDLVEFLGRGHYDHYVPSLVDHLADRSEYLTSYTQYQPEVAQGFLQALFEYQSIVSELTGLPVANCSMYDAATALGEAATLAARVRGVDGRRVLVPDLLADGRRSTLENYVAGTDLTVETYPTDDANVDRDGLAERLDGDAAMVYAESPTVRGTIEENLAAVGDLAADHGALFCLGSDPVSLAVLEEPAAVGADVVVGDAATLGLGAAYGMGLGMFATREEYLRQVPGRLVGAGEEEVGHPDGDGSVGASGGPSDAASGATGDGDAPTRRAYTLTLQTREQHIRKERATSNICTNQAWVALRTAMHAASLGPEGLVDLAGRCAREAAALADRLDALSGVVAPVHDRHHLREFVARTDQPARAVAGDLLDAGYAVHVVGDHEVQVCVTESNAGETDGLVAAFEEAAR